MNPRTALPTRTPLRRIGRLLAVLAAGSLAAVSLGTPAQAGSGTGTSLLWNYSSATSFVFHGTFPGVQAFGVGTDANGSRSLEVVVQDTVADGKCANVKIQVAGKADVLKQICGNGEQVNFTTPAAKGAMLITVFRTPVGNPQADRSLHLAIPDSSVDTDIRTAGTVVKLNYTSTSNFSYEIRRPGVVIVGSGSNSGSNKIVNGSLLHTGFLNTCAIARSELATPPISAVNCSPAAPEEEFSSTFDPSDNLSGCLLVVATATTRCNILMLPTT